MDNDLTDEGAFFFFNWLKKHRMRDVKHSLQIVSCDFQFNKIMWKTLKEVESQLGINKKFHADRKKLEIETEMKIM